MSMFKTDAAKQAARAEEEKEKEAAKVGTRLNCVLALDPGQS